MKEIIQKFRDGDSITDAELDSLVTLLETTERLLRPFGERYRLVWVDVFRDLERAKGYVESRKSR